MKAYRPVLTLNLHRSIRCYGHCLTGSMYERGHKSLVNRNWRVSWLWPWPICAYHDITQEDEAYGDEIARTEHSMVLYEPANIYNQFPTPLL